MNVWVVTCAEQIYFPPGSLVMSPDHLNPITGNQQSATAKLINTTRGDAGNYSSGFWFNQSNKLHESVLLDVFSKIISRYLNSYLADI